MIEVCGYACVAECANQVQIFGPAGDQLTHTGYIQSISVNGLKLFQRFGLVGQAYQQLALERDYNNQLKYQTVRTIRMRICIAEDAADWKVLKNDSLFCMICLGHSLNPQVNLAGIEIIGKHVPCKSTDPTIIRLPEALCRLGDSGLHFFTSADEIHAIWQEYTDRSLTKALVASVKLSAAYQPTT